MAPTAEGRDRMVGPDQEAARKAEQDEVDQLSEKLAANYNRLTGDLNRTEPMQRMYDAMDRVTAEAEHLCKQVQDQVELEHLADAAREAGITLGRIDGVDVALAPYYVHNSRPAMVPIPEWIRRRMRMAELAHEWAAGESGPRLCIPDGMDFLRLLREAPKVRRAVQKLLAGCLVQLVADLTTRPMAAQDPENNNQGPDALKYYAEHLRNAGALVVGEQFEAPVFFEPVTEWAKSRAGLDLGQDGLNLWQKYGFQEMQLNTTPGLTSSDPEDGPISVGGLAADMGEQVGPDVAAINVIFDGPPGHIAGRFIEVEDDEGCGLGIGDWIEKEGGQWALRIPLPLVTVGPLVTPPEETVQADYEIVELPEGVEPAAGKVDVEGVLSVLRTYGQVSVMLGCRRDSEDSEGTDVWVENRPDNGEDIRLSGDSLQGAVMAALSALMVERDGVLEGTVTDETG